MAVGMVCNEENLIVTNGRTEVEIENFEVFEVLSDELNTALSDLAPFDFESGELPEPSGDQGERAISEVLAVI